MEKKNYYFAVFEGDFCTEVPVVEKKLLGVYKYKIYD